MTDYQKYINALRKCAKEHENDKTFTGHIIVSDLCRDTANLLEALEQEPTTKIEESNFSQEQYLADIQSAYDCGKSVIDKIRAEIVDLGQRTMNDNRASGIWACRDILDKYKAESEG